MANNKNKCDKKKKQLAKCALCYQGCMVT